MMEGITFPPMSVDDKCCLLQWRRRRDVRLLAASAELVSCGEILLEIGPRHNLFLTKTKKIGTPHTADVKSYSGDQCRQPVGFWLHLAGACEQESEEAATLTGWALPGSTRF